MSHTPHDLYADEPAPAPPPPSPVTVAHRSPAIGTIALGLALMVLGAGAVLRELTGFNPDPRAAAAALLAAFGTLLVVTSGAGLFRHRGGRRPPHQARVP